MNCTGGPCASKDQIACVKNILDLKEIVIKLLHDSPVESTNQWLDNCHSKLAEFVDDHDRLKRQIGDAMRLAMLAESSDLEIITELTKLIGNCSSEEELLNLESYVLFLQCDPRLFQATSEGVKLIQSKRESFHRNT